MSLVGTVDSGLRITERVEKSESIERRTNTLFVKILANNILTR